MTNTLSNMHLCVHWQTLGPYHVARLNRAARLCERHGVGLTALELSGTDIAGLSASGLEGGSSFRRETLFRGLDAHSLSPRVVDRAVRHALDRLKPDVVAISSYSTPDARAALAWCLENERASILMTDSRREDAVRTAWRERLKSLLISRFGAALVAGKPQREYLESFGFPSTNIFLGYDVVDNDFFARTADQIRANPKLSRELPGLNDPHPFFLSVGRIIGRKNIDGLIDGYRIYSERTSDPWRLVIVGDGQDLPRITQKIRDARIEGITLAGGQPPEKVPAYYALASAFVHAARADQWGLVVNEAMASGLPTIVSNGTGCAEDLVLEGETGFQFSPHDSSELARLMGQVAANDVLRANMGINARRLIDRWSLDKFAESLLLAMHAAQTSVVRRSSFDTAILMIKTLRLIAPRMTSFHTVET